VDLKPLFKFLGLRGNALAEVVAVGRLGYWMHFAWVVCAIMTHPFFPLHLYYLATMASLFVLIGGADLRAHHVFVVVHLGRLLLPMESICRLFKPVSDENIRNMAWISFGFAVLAINWGSAFFGQRYDSLFDKAAFWVLLLLPLAPGLWYFAMGGKNNHSIKSDPSGVFVTFPAGKTENHGGRSAGAGAASGEGSCFDRSTCRLPLAPERRKTRGARPRGQTLELAATLPAGNTKRQGGPSAGAGSGGRTSFDRQIGRLGMVRAASG